MKLALTTAFLASTAFGNPGIAGSVTEAGINNAKNFLVPYIFQYLHNITIPDVKIDQGTISNIVADVPQPASLKDISLTFDGKNNGLIFNAQQMGADVNADFDITILYIEAKGHAAIDASQISMNIEAELLSQVADDGELAPMINFNTVDLTIPPSALTINITGNIDPSVVKLIVTLFKGTLIQEIESGLKTALQQNVTQLVNADLKMYGNRVQFNNTKGLELDFAITAKPQIPADGSYMGFAVNGTFFDTLANTPSGLAAVDIPVRDPKGKDLQVYLTQYTLNTFLDSSFKAKEAIDIAALIANITGFTVNTTTVGAAIPQILKAYGANKPMSIVGELINSPSKFTFTEGQADLKGSLRLTFGVDGQDVLVAQFPANEFQGNLYVTNAKVFGKIAKYEPGQITVVSTKIAGLDSATLNTEIHNFVSTMVKETNTELAAGIPIETIYGISLANSSILIKNGYVSVGITPSYSEEEVSALPIFAQA